MKYNKEQFEILVTALRQLGRYFKLENVNTHSLHFEVFQQFSGGHSHNSIYIEDDILRRKYAIQDASKSSKLIDFDYNFQLYPDGCNDNHVDTAMKRALKIVNNK